MIRKHDVGQFNKHNALRLSVSVIVLNTAIAGFANETIPNPSLKPQLLNKLDQDAIVHGEIPHPTLKPNAQEPILFADISTLTPNIKPRPRKALERTLIRKTSHPVPTLKPRGRHKRNIPLLAQVAAPTPNLKTQSQSSSVIKSYNANYFEQYAPVTAADMVAQIPNFSLSNVEIKRGLGQGGANVLINGVRLTGKNNDARSALTRMPAASIEKIEILNGSSLNIPGLSGSVANIVTNQNEFSGSWKYTAEFQKRSRANLFGFEGSVSGSRGPFEYVIGFESGPFRDTEVGLEEIANGRREIIEMRDERALVFEDNPQVSAEFTYSPANGHIAHLNANYQLTNFRFSEASVQSALTNEGTDGQRLTSTGEDGWNGELGGDYAFNLGPGSLKLIGITRHTETDLSDTFRAFDSSGNDLTEIFTQASKSGETIARGEYSFKQDESRDWQFAVETAFNFLEIDATLAEIDTNGNLIPIPFPDSSSRVEEKRAESILTHNWKVSDKFSLQASAGVEYSELTQTGPRGLTREFVRPKGLLSSTYTVSDSFNIRTKLERKVGQLDLEPSISSISLADDVANGANLEIVPAQSWDGEIEFEKSWANGVSGTLKLYGQKIEDVVDRIPLANGGDAIGNIDNAEVLGVGLVGTVLLDNFGLNGAKLDVELVAEDSSVTDPLTGLDRRFSGGVVSSYALNFRHDIPNSNLAWGTDLSGFRDSAEIRLNQTSHFTQGEPEVNFFIEHKDVLGLTLRADVKNAFSADYSFGRNLFDGDNRAVGNFIRSERRVRDAAPKYGISISGTF